MHAKVSSPADSSPTDSDRSERESTRPIRALNRGLDVLTELNRLERAPINTLASAVGLPRTTTYRILETLRLAGYVERDPHDDCYRPTIMVRGLSDGFDDEAMVAHIAKPHLAALCEQIIWPVAIATPSGATMMIREATDRQSPLAIEHYGAGVRVPMLASAAGRAYLAYCSPPQREALIDLLSRDAHPGLRHGAARPARIRGNQSRDSPAGEGSDSRGDDGPLCGYRGEPAGGGGSIPAEDARRGGEDRTRVRLIGIA